ncbi:integrase catalytic domain-containing protein [Nephila pilipes]|uniref:Integrase catalytic domain-containing protein n=1 Tax=Nephila pilipes TaxID=299642 RepID=A0A8X6QBD8_NEPPI|nr:integrase catalytic domain-containing protein [Nephila pilipes]
MLLSQSSYGDAIPRDLHGFCDSSEKALGAAIYIISKFISGEVKTSLVCSKSRVCPIKTLTIPLLELSAALLLSCLVLRHCFGHYTTWLIRLGYIEELYVGMVPVCLNLNIPPPTDSVNPLNDTYNGELRPSVQQVLLVDYKEYFVANFLNPTNNFTKFCCILSHIFRFYHNTKNPKKLKAGNLNIKELNHAWIVMVRLIQSNECSVSISCLEKGKDVQYSKISNSTPSLRSNEILYLGGSFQTAYVD